MQRLCRGCKKARQTLYSIRRALLLFGIQECALVAAALAAAMVAVLFQLAHDGFRVDALTTVVVGQSGFDGLLSQKQSSGP